MDHNEWMDSLTLNYWLLEVNHYGCSVFLILRQDGPLDDVLVFNVIVEGAAMESKISLIEVHRVFPSWNS